MSKASFDAALAKGVDFEDNVAFPFLLDYLDGAWVEETRNHQRTNTGHKGPLAQRKIYGDVETLALPDFRVTAKLAPMGLEHSNGFYWIDAKWKNKTFYRGGYTLVTIDPKAYRDYAAIQKELGGDVYILFGIESYRKLYLEQIGNVHMWHVFNNSFDNFGRDGETPCYNIDNMQQVGTW